MPVSGKATGSLFSKYKVQTKPTIIRSRKKKQFPMSGEDKQSQIGLLLIHFDELLDRVR